MNMRKIMKKVEAVSPIIATLMLVLVAVGAAGGFYVWQTGWQGDIQGKAGGADLQAGLTIGGSTTVYEFANYGAQYFEGANPNYKINVQKGGSGAGIAAVGTGAIDIGCSSKPLSATDKINYPDLNGDGKKDIGREMVETFVAYDAVVLIVKSGHSLVSMNDTVLSAIYAVNGGKTYTPPAWLPAGVDNKYQWNEIPTKWNDSTTTCTETDTIAIWDRSDVSGTEETFSKHFILKAVSDKNTLEEASIMCAPNQVPSNQDMVVKIAESSKNLGFAAYGVAKAATGLKMIPVYLDGNTGSLAGKVADPNSGSFVAQCKALEFEGAKKLYMITVGEPAGAIGEFINFVLAPEMNQLVCTAGGYITKY